MPAIPEFAHSLFLEGPAGAGKTSAALAYARSLLEAGIPGESILIWVPDGNYAARIQAAFPSQLHPDLDIPSNFYQNQVTHSLPDLGEIPELPSGAPETQMIDDLMARHYLLKIAEPYIESGLFQGLRLSKSRIATQIFRIRQQALLNELTIDTAVQKLISAAPNRKIYPRIYQAIAQILEGYDTFCQERALLDSVAQQLIFTRHVLTRQDFQEEFANQYRFLIADNLEETSALDHLFITQSMELVEKTLILYDHDAGFRDFSGANPSSALRLRKICRTRQAWTDPVQTSAGVSALMNRVISNASDESESQAHDSLSPSPDGHEVISVDYYPQMVDACLDRIRYLTKEKHIPPKSIVILVPYLTDSLEWVLKTGLSELALNSITFTSSHLLNKDPFTQAVLAILRLANPDLLQPSRADIAQLIFQLIHNTDPIRADLLAQHAYKTELLSFDNVNHRFQERITVQVGQAYEKFRVWLRENAAFAQHASSSIFLENLFNDFLNQPDYKFFHNPGLRRLGAELIERAKQFEQTASIEKIDEIGSVNTVAFFNFMHEEIASEPILPFASDGILISDPATFLCQNQTFAYQFWLDIGHPVWSRRSGQDLANPIALKDKNPSDLFTDEDQILKLQKEQLRMLLLGLLRRCSEKAFLLAYGNRDAKTNRLIFDLLGSFQKRSVNS